MSLSIQLTITVPLPEGDINVDTYIDQVVTHTEKAFVGSTVEIDDWDLS